MNEELQLKIVLFVWVSAILCILLVFWIGSRRDKAARKKNVLGNLQALRSGKDCLGRPLSNYDGRSVDFAVFEIKMWTDQLKMSLENLGTSEQELADFEKKDNLRLAQVYVKWLKSGEYFSAYEIDNLLRYIKNSGQKLEDFGLTKVEVLKAFDIYYSLQKEEIEKNLEKKNVEEMSELVLHRKEVLKALEMKEDESSG